MIVIEKLLRNLPEYYDIAEYPVIAMSVTGATNHNLNPDTGVLVIGTGAETYNIQVRGKTLTEMSALITAATGLAVEVHKPEVMQLFWFTLSAGPRPDGLYYETSLLRRLWGAVAQFLVDTRTDYLKGIDECYFGRSDGDWLNLWANYFGHSRFTGEVDLVFLARVLQEIKCLKNNDVALANLVSKATGYYCRIKPTVTANTFGVYFTGVDITDLPQEQIDRILDTITKYKAAGNFPVFYVSNNLLHTNIATENLNDPEFVVAPSNDGFTLVNITHS
jgi:hypothetical protein